MGVDYCLLCKKCREASEALMKLDFNDVSEQLEQESSYPYAYYKKGIDLIFFKEDMDVKAELLIKWLTKHKEHGEIIFEASI